MLVIGHLTIIDLNSINLNNWHGRLSIYVCACWFVLLTSYWTTRGYQMFQSGLYYSHHIDLPEVMKCFYLVCINHNILNYQRLSNVSIWFVLFTSYRPTSGYQTFQSGLYYSHHIELPEVIKRFNLVCITHIILNYQRLSNVSIIRGLLSWLSQQWTKMKMNANVCQCSEMWSSSHWSSTRRLFKIKLYRSKSIQALYDMRNTASEESTHNNSPQPAYTNSMFHLSLL